MLICDVICEKVSSLISCFTVQESELVSSIWEDDPYPMNWEFWREKSQNLDFLSVFYYSFKPFYNIIVISKYLPFRYNQWLNQLADNDLNKFTILFKETFKDYFFTWNWDFFFQNWERKTPILFAFGNIAQ